jgi:hypothetical protein
MTQANETRLLNSLDPVDHDELAIAAARPVFAELFAHIVAESASGIEASAVPNSVPVGALAEVRPGRLPRPRLAVISAAAVLLLAVGLPVTLERGGGGLRRPMTTSWRAARSLPAGPRTSNRGARSGSWRLVSDIVATGWQLDTSGPAPGALTCPTASACYVTGDGSTSDTGPSDLDSLYFSHNRGTSWAVLPLPAGFSFTAPISCSGAAACAGGGVYKGETVFISTVDAGHQWTLLPVSLPAEFLSLFCPSTATCDGIVAPSAVVAEISGRAELTSQPSEEFVRTTDGGRFWSTEALPVGDSITSLACPSTKTCAAIGSVVSSRGKEAVLSGLVLITRDAGATWVKGTLPDGFGFDYLSTISCGDIAHCMALGVLGGATAIVSGVATTSDGGLTWQLRPLPTDVPFPQLDSASCPTAQRCWVAGEQAVPQHIGNVDDAGSAVLLGTADGGTRWVKSTFVVPRGAPNDISGDAYMAIGTISCPTATLCVALGAADQGSTGTPVYRYVSANSL